MFRVVYKKMCLFFLGNIAALVPPTPTTAT